MTDDADVFIATTKPAPGWLSGFVEISEKAVIPGEGWRKTGTLAYFKKRFQKSERVTLGPKGSGGGGADAMYHVVVKRAP